LAGFEDAEYRQGGHAVSQRSRTRRNAGEEVFALQAQRFGGIDLDHRFGIAAGDGNPVGPSNAGVVNFQLASWLRIVEDGHLLLANHHQALLFVGVKPADEDVGADAIREPKGGHGRVGDARLQIGAADREDTLRLGANQAMNH
jgi:hypothetical protein